MTDRKNNTPSADEFEAAARIFLEEEASGVDELPTATFFEILSLIEKEKQAQAIEVDAEVDAEAQTLMLSAPPDAPITARGNELIVEGRRVVVRLKKQETTATPS
jgi:hypothetical protein